MHQKHKIKVHTNFLGYPTALRFRGSVIPRTIFPTLLLSAWATFVYFINSYDYLSFSISQTVLITITSFVISLLLAFRTNTAYDRYWEGRRVFSTLMSNTRSLSRLIWVGVSTLPNTPEVQEKKYGVQLVFATFVSLKNRVRGEFGLVNAEGQLREEYMKLLPISNPLDVLYTFPQETPFLPQYFVYLLNSYLLSMNKLERLDTPQLSTCILLLNSISECLASLERILYTPIPKAYNIHLKQSVYLYLFVLPLQLHPLFKAYSILITALATFTYIGVDMIGTEIENPFGTDDNDLPLDSYVNELQSEMDIMFQTEWNPSWHSTTNTTAVSFPPPPSSSTNPPTLPPLEKLELELPSKRISLASSPTSP